MNKLPLETASPLTPSPEKNLPWIGTANFANVLTPPLPPSRSAMTMLILSGLVKILSGRQRRQMRLICNNPPPKPPEQRQRLLARIRNMLARSLARRKRKDAENGHAGVWVWADDLSLAKTPQYTDER